MDTNGELKVIEQAKQGDMLSFRLLVDRYKNMAFHIAIQVIKNKEDAEEVVQDVFLNVFRSINKFKGESKFSTWLYKIVYNQAISKTRRKQLDTSNIDDVQVTDDSIVETYEAFSKLEEEERSIVLKKAIDKLGQDEALIITLFYLDENSVEEINKMTGLSISNIKVKLFRARKRLFVILAETQNKEVFDGLM